MTQHPLRYVTRPNKADGVTKVIIRRDNAYVRVCDTNETVEQDLANSLSDQFSYADSAPIYQGALFELLGYSADTQTAEHISEGTFIPPLDTDPTTVKNAEGDRTNLVQDGHW